MKFKSPWTLVFLVLAASLWRLHAAKFAIFIALAPILTIAVVGSMYDEIDEYQKTGIKPWWLYLPFAPRVAAWPRLSFLQKRVISVLAVVWAFLWILLA